MKTAIITGASRGIGREAALALSADYDMIAITSFRHSDELNELAHLIEEKGVRCLFRSGDIGDYDFVKDFIAEVAEESGGRIDLLVNNAAVSYTGLLTDMTSCDWRRIIDTNITSVFNTCRLAVPYMVHNKSGRIINISSVWGERGASCEVAYSATKGAVNAFTKALAKELAPSGIQVNAIAFGMVDTEMNGRLSDEEKLAITDDIPAGYIMSPSEAGAFIREVSGLGDYMTGQIITCDGGWQV